MKLKKLILTNFQGIKDLTIEPDGKSISIYGDNSTGKTTIYNALTWLLFDKASTGAKNFTPKPRDAHGEVHNIESSASGTFIKDNGEQISFKKTFKEVYRKKRGSIDSEFEGNTIDYFINGVPSKKAEYDATVLICCGRNSQILTMPDYFPDTLDWQTRRKILLEVCGDVDDQMVIDSNPELAPLKQYLTIPGTTDSYYTTDEYLKIAKSRMTECNKELQSIPVRIDEASRTKVECKNVSLEELDEQITAKETHINEMRAEMDRVASTKAVDEIKSEISVVDGLMLKGRQEHHRSLTEGLAKQQAELNELNKEYTKACQEHAAKLTEVTTIDDKLTQATELRTDLLKQMKAVQERQWDKSREICPTCGRVLDEDKLTAARQAWEKKNEDDISAIKNRGKACTKDVIAGLEKTLETKRAELAQCKDRSNDIAGKILVLQTEMDEIHPTPYEDTDEYKGLAERKKNLEGNLAVEYEEVEKAKGKKQSIIEAEVDLLYALRDLKKTIEHNRNADDRISALSEREVALAKEYAHFEKGVWLCEQFIRKKVSLLDDKVNGMFHSVRFRLFEDQINGGLKEGCEVMIPTADGRMIPYPFANNAAKVNAGLEIIAVLGKAWGQTMPVVFDNSESVTHLNRPEGLQIIRLVVSEPDKKLRIDFDE